MIEHIQIEFNRGLNILTGETGAGKSILLGALGMVIGHRSNLDVIRSNADFMRVEAVFSIMNEQAIKYFLLKNNILIEDDTLIITRQILASGRNIIQINNCHTTLAILRQLGEMLVDIHGQHANQALLKPQKQLNLIDEYDNGAINRQKAVYAQIYYHWLELKEKLAKSKTNTQEMAQRLDMLNWQINEIQNAKLEVDEDTKLEEQIKVLANAEKISLLSQNAYNLLYEGGNILSSLAQLRKDTESLAHYDENMAKVHQSVEDAYFQLQDSADEIRDFGEKIDYSPQKLDAMQSRMEEINKLRRKYGSSIEEILAYCEKAKDELSYIENYDANLAQLEQEVADLTQELKQEAATLHKLREQSATKLTDDIITELKSLSMPDARMKVNLWLNDDFSENGADDVEFLFSANLGEDMKLLQKIVSGGELSRIALAIKTITAQKDDVELMVFDEVDSGVGGKTAQMMAEKIARISRYRQVICITHLPQIAAMADAHFYIHKETKDNKTFTNITEIDYGARLAEIARMASGTELTQASMENAEEMLANARHKKELLSI
ncbi:Recombination protein N [Megamonas hypermegale]|uniref:DNA repair protein RecN n=1 Tax=Megamonas hypermegale TaxID=158847 RepID=A0A239THT9_9FIRM|nr:Recombination protein N [Megamonas hypermegale]